MKHCLPCYCNDRIDLVSTAAPL